MSRPTALRVMLVDMELVGARRVSVRVTVQLGGTRLRRLPLVPLHLTALRVLLAHTMM